MTDGTLEKIAYHARRFRHAHRSKSGTEPPKVKAVCGRDAWRYCLADPAVLRFILDVSKPLEQFLYEGVEVQLDMNAPAGLIQLWADGEPFALLEPTPNPSTTPAAEQE